MIGIIKVTGRSMLPVLKDGDYVITIKPRTPPRAGFIYVLSHPKHGKIIKRVAKIDNHIAAYKSDNIEGSFGEIGVDRLIGLAWLAVTPKGIRRLKPAAGKTS